MSKQPEALRLALWLDGAYEGEAQDAAAELRRLASINAELLEALRELEGMAERYRPPGASMPDAQNKARAAIRRATEEA